MIDENILESTKAGLDTGMTVRHITTYALATCKPDADVKEVLGDPHLQSFDCIPVRTNRVIVGCIWRSPDLVGPVREHMKPITEDLLVSADLPLTQFIPVFADKSHRLVLDGTSIQGIVTWSDLQKLPVRLFTFSLITHLELVMAQTIRGHFSTEEEWYEMLSGERHKYINGRLRSLQRKNLEPPLIELTGIRDKRDILIQRFQLGEQFEQDLKAIEELRNTTAHAGTYAESPDAVQAFVHTLQRAEHWIDYLTHLNAPSSMDN